MDDGSEIFAICELDDIAPGSAKPFSLFRAAPNGEGKSFPSSGCAARLVR
ncbi:MAG TPA: hypothetical protein VLT37_06005 [Acidocella sp.]|nr:hypothetical protein [Acidocella sp.]